jgi:uncharacterized membrane protein YfcA
MLRSNFVFGQEEDLPWAGVIRASTDDAGFIGMELLQNELLQYETWQLVTAAMILFGSSLLQAVIGFGAGVFGIPLLLMAGIDYRTAIPIIVMTSMIQSLIGSFRLREHAQWRIAWRPAAIRVVIMPLGGLLLLVVGRLGASYVRQAIGVVLLLIVIVKWVIKVEPVKELSERWTWVAFPISGFLLGFCGMGGPAVAIWVMAQPWDSLRSRAFLFNMLVTGMVSLSIQLVLLFGVKAVLGLAIGAAGLPLVFLGTMLGMRIGDRLPRARLQAISLSVLLLIAINAILTPIIRKPDESPDKSVHTDSPEVTFKTTVITGQRADRSVIFCLSREAEKLGFPLFSPPWAHNCSGKVTVGQHRSLLLAPPITKDARRNHAEAVPPRAVMGWMETASTRSTDAQTLF